jgi:pimeloyl-ACP methyl ester carboxylesterase
MVVLTEGAAARAAPPPATVRRDVVVDGLRIAVFESGMGEPCLLLHGYPQNHRCWRHVAAALAASHRVLAVDWFGWGRSERSLQASFDYDEEASRIGKLLDTLGVERANVFAHDYGAFLALGFAVRRPQRLLRLAILNSRAHATFPAPFYGQFAALSRLGRMPGVFASLPLHRLHASSLKRYVALGAWSGDDLEDYVGWMRTRDGRRWLGHFYRCYDVKLRPELREGCSRIHVPVAVLWGDRDPFCPFEIAADLATRIPKARLVRIEGADHYVMEERPREVLAGLCDLLMQPPAARLTASRFDSLDVARGG